LISHPVVQNIAVLGSGTALAQAVNIAATPFLAAVYGPDSFGIMAIFMGLVLVAGTMASLTYDSAIVLASDEIEAEALVSICTRIICGAVVLVFASALTFVMVFDEAEPGIHVGLLIAAPVGVLFLGYFNVTTNWMTRTEGFREISAANLIRSVGAVIGQLGLGLLNSGGLGLIAGRVLGQGAATLYLAKKGDLLKPSYWFGPVSRFWGVARKYYRFPIYKAPQSAIVLVADQAPALALGFFFGPIPAGLYWLADRILNLPCVVLSESTARVFYSEATKRHQDNKPLTPILVKTIVSLSSLAVIPSLVLVLVAQELLAVLGDQWRAAGSYVQWLTLWAFFRFSCAPVMAIFMILNAQKSLLKIDSFAMLARVPVIVVAGLFGDPLILVATISIFESLKILITVFVILSKIKYRHIEC
jgi:O-antigen/teichoic acid export membrane protein